MNEIIKPCSYKDTDFNYKEIGVDEDTLPDRIDSPKKF